MRKITFALRLRPSLPAELSKAVADNAAINHFDDTALGNIQHVMKILDRAGVGTPPL